MNFGIAKRIYGTLIVGATATSMVCAQPAFAECKPGHFVAMPGGSICTPNSLLNIVQRATNVEKRGTGKLKLGGDEVDNG